MNTSSPKELIDKTREGDTESLAQRLDVILPPEGTNIIQKLEKRVERLEKKIDKKK